MIHPEIYHAVKTRGPITRRDLARAVGLTERQVRAAIHEMNMEGIPIVSAGGGFILAGDDTHRYVEFFGDDILRASIRRMKSAALSILKRCAALQKISVGEAVRQMELFASEEDR